MIFAKFFTNKSDQPHQKGRQPTWHSSHLMIEEIASLVMDLQIECDGQHICQQYIVSLINLYTDAIEHYELIDAHKTEIYKKRLQNFLSKSTVLSALHGKDSLLISKKETVQRATQESIVNSKEMANRLIDRHQRKIDSSKKIVQADIKTQKESLDNRIERRKSMSNKSINSEKQNTNTLNTKNNRMQTNIFLSTKQMKMRKVFI